MYYNILHTNSYFLLDNYRCTYIFVIYHSDLRDENQYYAL